MWKSRSEADELLSVVEVVNGSGIQKFGVISYEMGLLFDVTKWALCECYNLGLCDTIPSDSMHIKQCYDMGMLWNGIFY